MIWSNQSPEIAKCLNTVKIATRQKERKRSKGTGQPQCANPLVSPSPHQRTCSPIKSEIVGAESILFFGRQMRQGVMEWWIDGCELHQTSPHHRHWETCRAACREERAWPLVAMGTTVHAWVEWTHLSLPLPRFDYTWIDTSAWAEGSERGNLSCLHLSISLKLFSLFVSQSHGRDKNTWETQIWKSCTVT